MEPAWRKKEKELKRELVQGDALSRRERGIDLLKELRGECGVVLGESNRAVIVSRSRRTSVRQTSVRQTSVESDRRG